MMWDTALAGVYDRFVNRRPTWLAALIVAILFSGATNALAADRTQSIELRPDSTTETASRAAATAAAPRDLGADERAGGHTLSRHVGKSDAELAARLARERDISAASTYTDRTAAERTVGAALAQSKARIDGWLARRGSRPNLVITYTQPTGPPIGRALRRGQRTAVACYGALVVLRWDNRRGHWYVLTSYPEA
jgi:hypothetical protein